MGMEMVKGWLGGSIRCGSVDSIVHLFIYLFVWYGYSSYFPPVTVSFVPSIFSFRNS